MALADRLKDTPQRQTGKPCSVGALEDTLEPAELDAFRAMLHTLGWSAKRVYDAVVEEGHFVSEQQINRHRSRSCRCFKPAA